MNNILEKVNFTLSTTVTNTSSLNVTPIAASMKIDITLRKTEDDSILWHSPTNKGVVNVSFNPSEVKVFLDNIYVSDVCGEEPVLPVYVNVKVAYADLTIEEFTQEASVEKHYDPSYVVDVVITGS